ncbi:TIGR03032 family protein [Lewinellaceae bacterium SD302]|nr:TIGR03032 family protein [Lewinellaceae bacterium SD302]
MPYTPAGPPPPFALRHSPQIPELLYGLGCTLALSTYQAGKIVCISAVNKEKLTQLPRTFKKPMGIAEDPATDRLAIACRDEVMILANSPGLAAHYPKSPGKYDAMYFPRLSYHTGDLDIHDINFGKGDELYAVNTRFSSIVKIDGRYNFTPYWSPPFIDKLASEDRCHLNGMAMLDGKPKYATSFSQTNTPQGWRPTVTETGTIFDVTTNEVIAHSLAMPHSPRIFNDELYVLLSATGELVKIDVNTGGYDVVCKIGGFVRGMALAGEYLFVGLSKLRENSSTFAKLPFAKNASRAGIEVIHLPTGARVGAIEYLSSVDEIYDVHVLAGKRRVNLLSTMTEDHKAALMIPEATYWARQQPATP